MRPHSPGARIQALLTQALGVIVGIGWLLGASSHVQAQAQLEPVAEGWLWPSFGILAIMAGNAIVVAAEASLELLRHLHLKPAAENPRLLSRLQHLLERKPTYLAATAFGIQACRLLLFLFALTLSPLLAPKLVESLGPLGARVAATLLLLIPILLVNMIVELVAKSYGELHALRVADRLYGPIRVSAILFALPTALVLSLGNLIAARFGGTTSFTVANQAEEEIKTIAESAEESGEIEAEEKEMLHSVFEFSDTIVREVMTPRVDLDALSVDADPAEVIALIQASGHSRIPLYEGTDDAIVGIVHAKDLLMAKLKGDPIDLRKLMRPALVVPENKDLHDLLREMRHARTQMAVVQDEFGGTSGIATIEDIVEELVGEIVDEYDEEEPEIVETDGGLIVDGKTHLDDVNQALRADFESDEFDTIGGFVFGLFGRQPAPDESIDAHGFRFAVAETDGRRIAKLRIEPAPAGLSATDDDQA